MFMQQKCFSVGSRLSAPTDAAMLLGFLPMKTRKGLAHGAQYTAATQAGFVDNVTYAEWRAQNGPASLTTSRTQNGGHKTGRLR